MSLVTSLKTLLAKQWPLSRRARRDSSTGPRQPASLHRWRSAWLRPWSVEHRLRALSVVLALALAVLGAVAVLSLRQANQVARQVAGTGQALMQSQRLAKTVSQALVGHPQAFVDVKESADLLARNVRGLGSGD